MVKNRTRTYGPYASVLEHITSQGIVDSSTPTTRSVDLDEYIVGSSNLWPVPRGMKSWYNSGSAVQIVQRKLQPMFFNGELFTSAPGNATYRWRGYAYPQRLSASMWPGANVPVLDGYGTTAFARTIPTIPITQAGVFLTELRDLPDSFRTFKHLDVIKDANTWKKGLHNMHHQAKVYKDLGKDYLNAKFGWESFLRDVCGTVDAAAKSNKAINQFLRDSGKLIRRRYDFPDVRTNDTPNSRNQDSPGDPGPVNIFFDTNSHGTITTTGNSIQKIWFVAAYTYFIPMGDDFESQRIRGEAVRHKLFGLRVDPDLLYQVAPWSWLFDYFGNMGDAVRNFSAFGHDNLTAKYAYIMCSVEAHKTYTWTGVSIRGKQVATSCTCSTMTYARGRGSAFSFLASSLNPKQVAILGALGFSRLPTKG